MFGIVNMFISAFIAYQDSYRLYKFFKDKQKRERAFDIVVWSGSCAYVGANHFLTNMRRKYLT